VHGLFEFQTLGLEFGAGQIAGDMDWFAGSQADRAEGVGNHEAVPARKAAATRSGKADGGDGNAGQAGELDDAVLDHLPRAARAIGGDHGVMAVLEPVDQPQEAFRPGPGGGAVGGVNAEAFHHLGDVFTVPALADDHRDSQTPDVIGRDHDPAVPEREEKRALLLP